MEELLDRSGVQQRHVRFQLGTDGGTLRVRRCAVRLAQKRGDGVDRRAQGEVALAQAVAFAVAAEETRAVKEDPWIDGEPGETVVRTVASRMRVPAGQTERISCRWKGERTAFGLLVGLILGPASPPSRSSPVSE